MLLNFNDILFSCSQALDSVEHELFGVTTDHSKRVAYLSARLGKLLGLSDDELIDLVGCALLHDNALSEYISTEFNKNRFYDNDPHELAIHCFLSEKNAANLPFKTNVGGAILYHHEHADGSGAFALKAADTPIKAQLIHFADSLDLFFDFSSLSYKDIDKLFDYVCLNEGKLYAPKIVELFLDNFSVQDLNLMSGEHIDNYFQHDFPKRMQNMNYDALSYIADFFALIIDYKSSYTKNHSICMAAKVRKMANYYGYNQEIAGKLYIAAALHDIGKLVISNDILEKPSKLTADEYAYMQTHAFATFQILSGIDGFEDISILASQHHEKLNGTGYPFGKSASELDKNSRLLACIDVYQALTEMRLYKEKMTHQQSMEILRNMATEGLLDGDIIEDINKVFNN